MDVTLQARAVMRCVQELRGRFGKSVVADVRRLQEPAHFLSSAWKARALMALCPTIRQQESKRSLKSWASEGYLQIGEGRYPLVGLGARAREAAVPEFSLAMKRPPERITRLKGAEGASAAFGAAGSDAPKKAKAAEGLDPMDAELFERLRALAQAHSNRGYRASLRGVFRCGLACYVPCPPEGRSPILGCSGRWAEKA